ncbi:MAG: VOC family protein [Acidobacteria bacterium]|nr:VOC family protein [Acidobacteriota bacterium]
MAFYTTTFPGSEIKNVARTGKDGPITSAEFVIGGQSFMGYNGGPYFRFSEGISLFVDCEDQEEVDEYWNKLVSAGRPPVAVWPLTDPAFGITWQSRRAFHGAHQRQESKEGTGCDGSDDEDGKAGRGGTGESIR